MARWNCKSFCGTEKVFTEVVQLFLCKCHPPYTLQRFMVGTRLDVVNSFGRTSKLHKVV